MCVVFLGIDAPRNVKALDVMRNSAAITWKPPQAHIDGYIISYRPEDDSRQVCGLLVYTYPTSSVLNMLLLQP